MGMWQRVCAWVLSLALVVGMGVPVVAWADDDAEEAETVTLTFRDAYSADGDELERVKVTIEAGSTLGELIASGELVLPAAESYTDEDGTRHEFVGWSGFLTSSSTYVVDPLCIGEVGFYATGAFKATYVEVAEGQHLVTFKNEYALYGIAVDEGAVPVYANERGSDEPYKLDGEDGLNYEFVGWYEGWASGWEYASEEDVTYAAGEELPAATADAVYTARFTSSVSSANVRFSFYEYRESTGRYAWTSKAQYQVAWGSNPFSAIEDVCALSFSQDGQLYTLIGWTEVTQEDPVPDSDVPEYGVYDLPLVGSEALQGTPYYEAYYYAIYEVTDEPVDVRFVVEGEQYAALEDVAVTTLLADAFAATGAAEPASADCGAFLGWAATEDAESALSGVVQVGSYAADGTATFYAVFEAVEDAAGSDAGEDGSEGESTEADAEDASTDVDASTADDGSGGSSGNATSSSTGSTSAKKAQSLKVTAKVKKLTASKLKKKARVVKALTVKGAKGTLTYTKLSGSKRLKVAKKTGKVTVKKNTKKGTYKMKVRVRAAATKAYKAASKTVTVKVKVK